VLSAIAATTMKAAFTMGTSCRAVTGSKIDARSTDFGDEEEEFLI